MPFFNIPVLAAAVRDPETIPVLVVVMIGLVLVFAILFILIAVIKIQGGLFGSAEKKKKIKSEAKEEITVPIQKAKPQNVPVPPVVEKGIPGEVVAAIVASIDAMSGGAYVLRAVGVHKKRRGAWGTAGVVQSTEPF